MGLVLSAFVVLAARANAQSAAPSASPTATSTQPATPSNLPQRPDVDEIEARVLVMNWLNAQQGRGFDVYSALYDSAFYGTKRIGNRTYRYDRRSWLADRKRMFAKPMQVEIRGVEIQTHLRLTFVTFEQVWSSGKFRDIGRKRLTLVATPDGARIRGEDMLTSKVEATGRTIAPSTEDFMSVVHTRRLYAVLADEADEAWSHGLAGLDSDESTTTDAARRLVLEASVPASAPKPPSGTLALYDASGVACHAKAGKRFLLRRVFNSDGSMSNPTVEREEGSRGRRTPRELAERIWEAASEGTLLVAELEVIDGSCEHALWARSTARPTPRVFTRAEATAELSARIARAVQKLPADERIQRTYRKIVKESFPDSGPDDGTTPRWERFDGSAPSVVVWNTAQDTMVTYAATAGGCGDFYGAIWVVFRLQGDTLSLVAQSEGSSVPDDLAFTSLVDLDGDGNVDMLGNTWNSARGEANVTARGDVRGMTLIQDISPPFHGCGC